MLIKVSKGVKIRKRYNQVPHLTQDTKTSYGSNVLFIVGNHATLLQRYHCTFSEKKKRASRTNVIGSFRRDVQGYSLEDAKLAEGPQCQIYRNNDPCLCM